MKTILVATDYSTPAGNAVDFAAHIAQESNAELILFNVFKLSIHASNSLASSSSIEKLEKRNEEHLTDIAKEIEDKFKISVRCEIRKADTIESLSEFMENHPVDLVVMGIESNLTEYKIFGNTTTAAVKLMQFPLLVVPNDSHFTELKNIMFACDVSYLKDGSELDILKQLVNTFNAQLEVFHVHSTDADKKNEEAFEQKMDGILHDVNHVYRYLINPLVGEGIKEGLEKNPADMLVMLHHKLGFLESIIRGSHSNQMTVETRVPLLVIPNESHS